MRLCINRQRAFDQLGLCKAGALFIKLGARKIEIAIEFVRSQQFKVDYIVWIAPAAFLSTKSYRAEIKKWSQSLERKIYFYSIESLAGTSNRLFDLQKLVDKFRIFCVVDESLTIKNSETGRTQNLLKIAKRFKYRLLLSGTPLTRGLTDLYAQIMFLNPKILNMTKSQFTNMFMHRVCTQDNTHRVLSSAEEEHRLIKILRPYIYEFDLNFDCKINLHDFNVPLSQKEAEYYKLEKENFLTNRGKLVFLEIVQKFQHIYTISKEKTFAMIQLVNEIIQRGEKVIVFVKFLDEIRFLKECKVINFEYVEMTGNVNKNKAAETFANDVQVMFSTYGAGGLAMHMPFCNNIIFFSQTFDYKDKVQSIDCIYKKGKTNQLNIYNFWVQTGLEKLIRDCQQRKENVLNNVCQYITKEDWLSL
ncbi:MAG: DEAD/DEAH box helicase [Alphaproteobacteria bacterium]|nr:DEAD/DEAH box helicase [Alphaproteobacteria bacterium]